MRLAKTCSLPHSETKSGRVGLSVREEISDVRDIESLLEVLLVLSLPIRMAKINGLTTDPLDHASRRRERWAEDCIQGNCVTGFGRKQ
ncbi:hypothetical protein HanXRQr2_Chr12g0555591 [Helianthus annuus]|uniref:Uncharacterized protein n=1 Tax=Helianthus annuus TaxID=4232 RepID=A0A9K3HIQ0_HELAN|nr:hypothetical protein HanXRQr2_Chr12g0555591 [Helianthus annuus]